MAEANPNTTTQSRSADVLAFPVQRRDVPMSNGGWTPQMEGEGVTRLKRPAIWAKPQRSPEMEIILALVEALKERSGTKTIGTAVLTKLGDALHDRTDTPDAPRVHQRIDPSLYAAVNALCGG